jgi:hypothetical protein
MGRMQALAAEGEAELARFLQPLPEGAAVRLRMLAHGWAMAGGSVQIGKLSIRLAAGSPPFTAGTLHPARDGHPTLEVARPPLATHGLGEQAWRDWCDERPELRAAGFDSARNYPLVRLDALSEPACARLALGLRDLLLAAAPDRSG